MPERIGGHGVTVNTEACGASDSGSIPDGHPNYKETCKACYANDFGVEMNQ